MNYRKKLELDSFHIEKYGHCIFERDVGEVLNDIEIALIEIQKAIEEELYDKAYALNDILLSKVW